jgi:hypothetical protein
MCIGLRVRYRQIDLSPQATVVLSQRSLIDDEGFHLAIELMYKNQSCLVERVKQN